MAYKTVENSEKLRDYRGDIRISRGPIDAPFLMLTLLLLTIGVVMVFSASYASAYYDLKDETGGNASYYFTRQLLFAVGGIIVMLLASRMPVNFYRKCAIWVLIGAGVLMVVVLVIGVGNEQATRWINLGPVTIQPSEIAKVGVILYFAHLICEYKNDMGTFRRGVLPFGIILVVLVGLLALQPHLSACIIILGIGFIMMFVGGTRTMWFVGGALLVAGLVGIMLFVVGYESERIGVWLDPFSDPRNDGFQVVQSLYAIGSGGLFGLGLGQSRQKYLYLPEEHNDYIFSIICEELGFIGATLILILFALLIIRGFWIALHCRDRYGFLVCTGITSLLAIQVLLNVAVCTNLVPATGISLPFFSYGGTALLMQLGEMGIILSISRDVPTRKIVKSRQIKKAAEQGV
ncbi:MAG: putative lipid II flippase FtsW [Oscillospiraceae bacterium]|jgi:cell division protein FtsW|nr:putative lipid II flippase FtsW [Oscillospiraceae bacterium]